MGYRNYMETIVGYDGFEASERALAGSPPGAEPERSPEPKELAQRRLVHPLAGTGDTMLGRKVARRRPVAPPRR